MTDDSGSAAAPGTVRGAAAVLIVESIALAVLGVFLVVKAIVGSPSSVAFAIVAGLIAIATGLILALLARGVRRCRGWAYVPVIVLQGVALPVGYSLAVQAHLWQYGGPVLVLVIAELYLLVTPSARRVLGPGAR